MVSLAASFLLFATSPQTTVDTFDSAGTRIAYATAGSGPAVILIHGWQADATMWGKDPSGNPRLGTDSLPGKRIIAIDCRGHGRSDRPHETERYGEAMAEDVVRLMDHLKIPRAQLVGHSMGVFLAGYVAAKYPDRVTSVLFVSQAPLRTGDDNSSGEVASFAEAVRSGKSMGQHLLDSAPKDAPKLTLEAANLFADRIYRGKDLAALAAAGLSFPKLAVSEAELGRFKGPVQFLYGSLEAGTLADRVSAWRKVLPQSTVRVVEGANHSTLLVRKEFGATLIDSIKRSSGE